MIWQIAGGVLIATIPMLVVAAGIFVVNQQQGDPKMGWGVVGVGIALAAGIIWLGF
jgi:hypothetical protein